MLLGSADPEHQAGGASQRERHAARLTEAEHRGHDGDDATDEENRFRERGRA